MIFNSQLKKEKKSNSEPGFFCQPSFLYLSNTIFQNIFHFFKENLVHMKQDHNIIEQTKAVQNVSIA